MNLPFQFVTQEIETSISSDQFWSSVNILNAKPHVVNKRLWGCKVIFKSYIKSTNLDLILNLKVRLPYSKDKKNDETIFIKLLKEFELEQESSVENFIEALVLELLPKAFTDSRAFLLVCTNKYECQVAYFDVTPIQSNQCLIPEFPYLLQLKDGKVLFKAVCDSTSKSYLWLKDTVLPQFIKWAITPVDKSANVSSLTLVSNEHYYQKYNELKNKYGKEMVNIWPECTDPAKFVYEDVAIATYLLLLWEEDRQKMQSTQLQSFVDLGCGNGLLVYLLAMEGHKGVGIDIRKRHIWNMYPEQVKLEEQTVTPSDKYLFPDTDWVIGNHSDELTPWIPVVAARSSYKCNFFLLPCCAYNFDGSKYQRQNSSKSQYTEYLEYIKDLSYQCGYDTEIDRLKIPSTKRICLVGRKRVYFENDHNDYCNKIQEIITSPNVALSNTTHIESEHWISDFKARDPIEKVKNCTRIDKNLIDSIVDRITSHILDNLSEKTSWSLGKTVEIHSLIELISKEELKAMKSECGGLQTLLRNHNHIFKVHRGKVQLRYPRTIDEMNAEIIEKSKKGGKVRIKQRPCWFYKNHPQGCPLTESSCSYIHVN